MGKLVQLEVHNFKSYRGHHVLLFGDSYFTSIIGPNGSGKSNSMDAISFVLGIKSAHLRSAQLSDLIYRGRVIGTTTVTADGTAVEANGAGNGETRATNGDSLSSSQRNDPQSAWVMAVFEDDAEQVHKWKRSITSAGQSEYRIDNRVVTQKAYNDALEEHGILIKARNFLVFQGDVESVASQNPKALTRLIEQISGSLEYKAEYEKLKVESDKASDLQATQLSSKRQINAEMKTFQEQKREAEAYEQKLAERDDAIVTHVLWKLFHFQQTIQASSEEIARHQEELKEHKRNVEKYVRKVDEAKSAHAKVSREVGKTERSIKGKEKEIEDAQNSLVPIDEKIKVSNGNLRQYENRIADLTKQRNEQTQQISKFKKDLAVAQKAQQKWEDEYRAAARQQGRELSPQDLQEYSKLRTEVQKQTQANQIEINKLERDVSTSKDTVRSLKQKVETFEGRVERLEDEIRRLQEQQQEWKSRLGEMQKDRTSKQQVFNKLQSDRRHTEQQYEELNQNLRDVVNKMAEVERGRQQSRKEISARDTVAKLKNIYGAGVHGRYSELVKPKQKKYDNAVATLLGWHLDAIIVDTEKTAKDCITYLKEQKIGQATFIPLDTITVKAVNQNLKGMHKGMRLGIDCIDYDPSLERAMASACGNSMICDDIKVAKYLCYEKGVDAKAVTLDGIVIAKGGTMTGGRLASDRNSQRFSDADFDKYQKQFDRLKAQLSALPKPDRRSQELENLQVDLADLDDRIRRSEDEIKSLNLNVDSKRKELQHNKQQLKEWQPDYKEKAQRLKNLQDSLSSYQDAVDQVADQVFATFCQRLGYTSIRDYESQQGSAEQEASERRLEFTKVISRLENMIDFHDKQLKNIEERVDALKVKSQRDETNIKEFDTEKNQLQDSIDILNAELEEFQEKLSALQEKLSERAGAVKQARDELEKRNEAEKGVIKAVDAEEASIKRTGTSRYALLRKCKVEQVKLPLAKGSKPLESLPLGDAARPDPDAMDIDEDPDSTELHQTEVDDYGIDIDFDGLDDDFKEDDSTACDTKLQEEISTLTADIEKSNPNMRATERLEKTEATLKETSKIWETARKDAAKKKRDFEDVKQRRLDLFQKAFNHISENIGGTYKDLTKSQQFPLGGQAYLDMEDSTEPYNAGLKYHAMPPLKRFRDMEHLSGGEKTIAALALLFAIHSYQPSPFFVLDEVDAALDNINVARVAKYVKEHANPGMQFIVISLKAGFFQESESLVGVMRDQQKMSSRVVSLDLRKYLP